MWLHGLPLTPSVAQWFSCTAWTTVWKPVTLIISTALDYPEAETVWNPEAGVQLTPIESVISQDCQVGDALAAQDKRMLIQCSSSASLFDIWTAFPLCQPLLGWAGVELPVLFLVSNQSARKLRQQPENWGHSTRVNQLEQIVLEPPGFCRHVLIPAHHVLAFTFTTPLTAAYG